MRISDWSSDVCSSDLTPADRLRHLFGDRHDGRIDAADDRHADPAAPRRRVHRRRPVSSGLPGRTRSEEHTSELQSLMRISYAVFCLKKKKNIKDICKNSTPTQKHSTEPQYMHI